MFIAFVLASLVLAVTPGPGVAYIVARTLAQGRAAGLVSVAGVAAGNLGNALGASLGLAALLAVSSTAFAVLKWAGVAYLMWLGVQALRRPRSDDLERTLVAAPQLAQLFRAGFAVALLNPKTALFFAAFLPQFMDPAAAAAPQAALLGGVFVGLAAITDTGYVLLAGALGRALAGRGARRSATLGRYATAATFIGWACTPQRHRCGHRAERGAGPRPARYTHRRAIGAGRPTSRSNAARTASSATDASSSNAALTARPSQRSSTRLWRSSQSTRVASTPSPSTPCV